MNKSKNIDVHSLWLDKLANQVNAGGLDVRCALSLAFYSGEFSCRERKNFREIGV
jgi:hypothetical protein